MLKHVLSRRTFIKQTTIQLSALIFSGRLKYIAVGKAVQTGSQNSAYGTGTYGQDIYSGYQTYLPFITKEGN